MSAFAGTWRLVRLALRRDRIKLPIWIIAIAGLLTSAVPTLKEVYGSSQETILQYASTTSHSKVALLFGGPVGGPYFGAIVMLEYFLFIAVLMIFMSYLTVIRHTRQNEETGRSELLGSAPVGRYAQLSSALIVAAGANLLIAGLVIPGLAHSGLPLDGSVAMALALAGIGLVFAGIGAIAAQIVGTARGAATLTGVVLGISVVLRGLGDAFGQIANNGMATSSSWLSWTSPIGWGQQMFPFHEQRWWVLGLLGAAFIILISLAFWLNRYRDHGMGMIPARLGAAKASKILLSPLGLAWRLQRVSLLAWGAGVVILGAIFGVASVEIKDFLVSNEQLSKVYASIGGNGNITDIFFSSMLVMMALVVAGYGIMAILKLRSEEASGHLEPVLGTSVSRLAWLLSHLLIVVAGVLLLAALAGFSTGLAYALTAGGDAWSQLGPLTVAGLVQAPAVLLLVGLSVAIFGLISRLSQSIVWTVFIISVAISMLGRLLKLPDWVFNLSPFYHTPTAPADSIDLAPLAAMSALALVLAIVGFIAFRQRSLIIGD